MKKLRIPAIIVLMALLLSLGTGALAVSDPDVDAAAVALVERGTGRVFYARNENVRMYPASLTKIMTVLVAIEAIEDNRVGLYDTVTATESMNADRDENGSNAGIQVGEILTVEDLLYCCMVASANEACNLLAEYIGGSVAGFVTMMNDRAAELGCTGTHFANPHGLHSETHYTTAWDMYLMTAAAMSNDLFAELASTTSYTIPATNMSEARQLQGTNALMTTQGYYGDKYYYEYASGVKTGHTEAAGYCLASTAAKDGLEFICIVMGAEAVWHDAENVDYGNFEDSITLYDWAFSSFSYREILSSTEIITQLPVAMAAGDADTVSLRANGSITALLANDDDLSKYERVITIYSERDGKTLTAPISAGEALGEISVVKDGESYGSTPLIATSSVELSRSQYIKDQVHEKLQSRGVKTVIWVLAILFALYLVLVIVYRVMRIRHVRAVRAAKRAKAQEQARRSSPPAVRDRPARAPTDGEAPASEQQRDYFAEFFRQDDEPENK